MDNLAHTLVGAALGRAVAGHRVGGAGVLGAVAGNAPDWTELLVASGFAPPRAGLTYLEWHRGITHSLLGAGIEIAALTLLTSLGVLWWSRRRGRGGLGAVPWRWVALCVAAAVLSHLYLDWQGSYGLRPFLPWSGRWYYVDWVAIVDPVFWLVPLVALLWGERRHWAPALVGLLTMGGVAWLVLWRGGDRVAGWLQLLTLAACGVAVVGWVRHWFGVAGRRAAAGSAMLVLGLYAVANAAASLPAKARVREAARDRFGPRAEWASLTVVGRPFQWDPVYASPDSVAAPGWAVARHLDHPAVARALRDTPQGRGMAQFARFLVAEVDSSGPVIVVYLRDARYTRAAREGWGVVAVRMDRVR
jgi:membrane-bound metal-dependent hydrolase YbcI (DUF457 family)